ncbi:MAG: carboxypeptidase regulatory-like domain-containing protein [Mogibacterium sp.]|nr:carboxypeptidase regulatory-like domain-containing protein [Mogibacterium sp.]
MKSGAKRLIAAGTTIATLFIVAAVIMGLQTKSMAAYGMKIAEADTLIEQEEYNDAILKYKEAIDDKPKEEEGYLKLSIAYEMVDRIDYAITTIEMGLEAIPDSERLKERYAELNQGKVQNELAISSDVLDSLASKSYYDYGKTNGIEKVKPLSNGEISVRVKGLNADLIYKNTSKNPNAVEGNAPTSDSLPAEVRFDNIMSLLGGSKSARYDDIKNLEVEGLKIVDYQEFGSAVSFGYGLYSFIIQSDEDGNISSASKNIVYIPSATNQASGDTKVKGKVINAINGDGVGKAKLVFKKSGSSDTFVTKTDSKGEYSAELDKGEYTVECTAEGFIDEVKTVYVPTYTSEWSCEIVMSPEMGDNEARIVLKWGSSPADLDSHLLWNSGHVWFGDKYSADAELDYDDRDGYGPETTTIHNLKGNYTFVVHDYLQEGGLAASGAEVTVYLPGEEPVTISIGGSGDAYTWEVFTLKDGKLKIINDIKEYDLGLNFDSDWDL